MEPKNYILDKAGAEQKLQRMALELAEDLNGDSVPVILIGIRNHGTIIAEKIGHLLKPYITNPLRIIAVSMNKSCPDKVILSEEINFDDLHVIIVDCLNPL